MRLAVRPLLLLLVTMRAASACTSPLTIAEARDAGTEAGAEETSTSPFSEGGFEASGDEPPELSDPIDAATG